MKNSKHITMLLTAIAVLIGIYVYIDKDAMQRFMEECQQHMRHFQCEALWRGGR